MKRILSAAALLLCLILLASCSAQDVLQDVGHKIAAGTDSVIEVMEDVQEQVASASNVPAADAPQATPVQGTTNQGTTVQDTMNQAGAASSPDAQAVEPSAPAITAPPAPTMAPAPATPDPNDFTALSADQCVTDQNGLPHITLDCDGANSINQDIENMFRYLVGSDGCTLYYEYYKNAGRVLSIMVSQLFDGDASYFTPFNLDLATGRRLNGSELLSLLGGNATVVADAELQLMGQEFEYQYGDMKNGEQAALYEEQYQRTTSPDNADTERLWLGSDGRLNFVAKIFSLAGAEYYEYPMDTGLRY